MKLHTSIFALIAVPLVAIAQSNDSYRCTMGDLVRRVVVEHETSSPVPCQVVYYKDTETPGDQRVLWRAQNDAAYCDERASEFVSKLEGWGWQCAAANAESDAAKEESSTD